MDRADVLATGPMMQRIEDGVLAHFTVHRLPAPAERDAFLAAVGPRIRGVVAVGHARIDGAFMDRLPKLEIVANMGVGYDSIDAAEAGRRGVIVTNTPDVLTEEVADTALGLLLMTVRELGAAERWLRDGQWAAKGHYPLTRTTLRGRSVGIVGFGRIGRAIAERVEAFGLPVAYHNRRPVAGETRRYYPDLIAMARDVDTLISVLPGGAATHHLIGADVLAALGANGVLINIGRGSVVDEAALVDALDRGVIASAGLDVFEVEPCRPDRLIAHERITLLPHVGSASHHTRDLMGQLVVDNLTSWFGSRRPLTPVAETPWAG
ncbi:2-hydroxyacid dehydrogenase [Prosthecomicrobium hirschii]|uniref:2-hydroxyacid dehydrogenase n=1 Tax=Prosthecodimorpha hirschii TaxID=665126 RepID=UPI00112B4A3E|nr:2-hydroxyacid dehydrogenase [Prosthecomicrobium hirschii]TPQ49317.1 2-hydroxyacid dehydrogenase [Prosthecomicrobium hirschii]